MRFVVPPGGVIVFSGAQLHSTVPNTTNVVRWSIDFRTINIDDIVSKRGAPNTDSASTGTSLRDFLRVADFAPIPTTSSRHMMTAFRWVEWPSSSRR